MRYRLYSYRFVLFFFLKVEIHTPAKKCGYLFAGVCRGCCMSEPIVKTIGFDGTGPFCKFIKFAKSKTKGLLPAGIDVCTSIPVGNSPDQLYEILLIFRFVRHCVKAVFADAVQDVPLILNQKIVVLQQVVPEFIQKGTVHVDQFAALRAF